MGASIWLSTLAEASVHAAMAANHFSWQAAVMAAIVLLVLYALARNLAKPDVVLLAAYTLILTLSIFSPDTKDPAAPHFPGVKEMAGVFGNDALLIVAVLFVVAKGLGATGAISLLTRRILGRPKSEIEAQARMLLPVTVSASLIHPTTTVAIFVPLIMEWGKKSGIAVSKLLIPLSYASIFGGTIMLISCSTNLVVQGMLTGAHANPRYANLVEPMTMFTLSRVGIPAAIAGLIYLIFASRWLPDRTPAINKLGDPREYTVEMMVQAGSAIDGQTIEQAGLRNLPGAYLAGVEREGQSLVAVGPQQILRGGDRLIFAGVVESVRDLQKNRGLIPATDQVFKLWGPRSKRHLVEAVVSTTCPIVGKSIREGRFRTRYDAAVIAVHRNGERINKKIGDIILRPGDTLLMETHASFTEMHKDNRDFYLVSTVADSTVPPFEKAWIAMAILFAMIIAVVFEKQLHITLMNAALIAAGLMVLTRCISGDQARKSIDWPILIAIGASFGLGLGMETSGLAAYVAGFMVGLFHPLGNMGILLGLYIMTLLFTHFVTHNAGAVIAFPIALQMAVRIGAVHFMPFAIVIAMAASNAYASPLSYATHLMVYGPGGYRFGDFVRMGLPLDIIIMGVTVALVPMFFPMY